MITATNHITWPQYECFTVGGGEFERLHISTPSFAFVALHMGLRIATNFKACRLSQPKFRANGDQQLLCFRTVKQLRLAAGLLDHEIFQQKTVIRW